MIEIYGEVIQRITATVGHLECGVKGVTREDCRLIDLNHDLGAGAAAPNRLSAFCKAAKNPVIGLEYPRLAGLILLSRCHHIGKDIEVDEIRISAWRNICGRKDAGTPVGDQ